MSETGRALLAAEDAWARLGTMVEARADHLAVRFPAAPLAPGGNQFREVRLPAGADPDAYLAARLDEAAAWGLGACRIEIDDRTFPANLGESLATQEFLPEVFTGLVARATDVPTATRLVPVRAVGPDDAAAVESLLAREQRERRRGAADAAAVLTLARARWWRRPARVWLADLDGVPSGFAVARQAGALHHVRKLHVAGDRRGLGIATALLRAVAEAAGSDGHVGLFAPSGAGLPAFYRARGFVAVTRRETWVRRSAPTA